jgi:tRNA (uracil-5-)-methyltransferase TRM9
MATNREAFDVIAPTWYGVRHWPLLRREMDGLAKRWKHGRIVNLGCGTGADFLPFASGFQLVGLDFSRGMLIQARRYQTVHNLSADLVQGDLTRLPFAERSVDHAVGIASYHLIEGESARRQAFSELLRVLRHAGEAFLTVWNHDQPRFQALSQDQTVPWRVGNVTVERYYHLYSISEFATELRQSGLEIVQLGYGTMRANETREDSRNICTLVRRPV